MHSAPGFHQQQNVAAPIAFFLAEYNTDHSESFPCGKLNAAWYKLFTFKSDFKY